MIETASINCFAIMVDFVAIDDLPFWRSGHMQTLTALFCPSVLKEVTIL